MWTDYLIILMLISGKLYILGWNCRGSTSKDKLNRLKRLMKENILDIIALVETKVDDEMVSHLCSKFAKFWNWVAIPAEGYFGGIIIFLAQTLRKDISGGPFLSCHSFNFFFFYR